MERLPLSHLFRSDVWLARGQSIPLLDDLNGKVLWFPLRHSVRALIFVCQQWHAISCRGTGAKTQVLILSTLMGLMAGKMRETACQWKCNALCWVTAGAGAGAGQRFSLGETLRVKQRVVAVGIVFGCQNMTCSLVLKNTPKKSCRLDFGKTAPKWCFHLLWLIICFTDGCRNNAVARCSSALAHILPQTVCPKNTSQRYIALCLLLEWILVRQTGEKQSLLMPAVPHLFFFFPPTLPVRIALPLQCASVRT